MATEQSSAGYTLPHTVSQHAHIWGFGKDLIRVRLLESLTLFSGQTLHVSIQNFSLTTTQQSCMFLTQTFKQRLVYK